MTKEFNMSTRSKVFSVLAVITMLIAACDRKPPTGSTQPQPTQACTGVSCKQIGDGIDTFFNGGTPQPEPCSNIIC